MRLAATLRPALAAQYGHVFCWTPVALGAGIGVYFAIPVEPGPLAWAGLAVLAVVATTAWVTQRISPATGLLVLVLLGIGLAALRTELVRAPVLDFRYYGPIEGRVVAIDRSASDAVRLTLDRVVLERVAPADTPGRVRVSLHGARDEPRPVPGRTVILTGHLSPPSGPVEPGGFDFRRHAWFQSIGAVGYTRTPVLTLAPPEEGDMRVALFRLRLQIAERIREAVPGRAGPFAAAILVGDRSGIDQDVLEDLRAANLAHLLAISGMHMGMLTGVVFTMVRLGLALIPITALRWPTKKIAAASAILAGAVYLALSGGAVATERAFIMVSVMLGALLIDRRAITLRAVALAALIVLIRRPEALLSPGFQMSFAATTALVAAFGSLRDINLSANGSGVRAKAIGWATGLILSSAVAGLATAPFAAAHFNQVPHYGLLANVLAVPIMGALIMPAAVLAVFLAPFGLDGIGFALMAPGINWILEVAARVASLDGALSFIVQPPSGVLPIVAVSGLFIVLWQGRSRALGLLGFAAAALIWSAAERPTLLISDTGGLVGLMTKEGRSLSKERGDGFAARGWLENDGDPADQATAFSRPGMTGIPGNMRIELDTLTAAHLTGRGARDRVDAACREVDLVIVNQRPDTRPENCWLLAPSDLRQSGAMAFTIDGEKIRIVTASEHTGQRAWSPKQRD